MTMAQDIGPRLLERAKELRPHGANPSAPVVQIASDLGIDVNLVLRPNAGHGKYHARCELRARPRILVYRTSPGAGIADLTAANEHLLSSRERFSVAHELGHCLAYLGHGLKPVPKSEDRREYWCQERAINEFANALLVPTWLSSRWRSQLATLDASCVFRIRRWATDCRASPEVVVTAFTRDAPGFGFLKVGEGVRVTTGKRILVVFHATASADVMLPNLFTHIDDVAFVNTITGTRGVALLPPSRLGSVELNSAQWAWSAATRNMQSRRNEFRKSVRLSGLAYWVCAFTGPSPDGGGQTDLPF